jgi:hypothetical protein
MYVSNARTNPAKRNKYSQVTYIGTTSLLQGRQKEHTPLIKGSKPPPLALSDAQLKPNARSL